jgi:hypothetical protein
MVGTKQQLAIQYVLEGATYSEAAERVGLTRSAVAGACRRRGIKVGYRPASHQAIRDSNDRMWSDPERKALYAARMKERWADKRKARRMRAALDTYRNEQREERHA